MFRQVVYYAKNITIFLVWWHFDEIHLESRANFLGENHLQRLHLGSLGCDLVWNTHGTSMYEGLNGIEGNTIVPQVIIDDVLVFQHICNKKKQKKDSVKRYKVLLVFRSMEILTFGMTSFCMHLKYNIKDIFNCGNNSQLTIPVAAQATSLNIPTQRVSRSILQQMSWLLLLTFCPQQSNDLIILLLRNQVRALLSLFPLR